jgi:hypothetical protein
LRCGRASGRAPDAIAASGAEHRVGRGALVPRLQIRHGLVMEEEEGGMEAGEDEVCIVAWVGNEGGLVRGVGEVFAEAPEADLERGGVAALETYTDPDRRPALRRRRSPDRRRVCAC